MNNTDRATDTPRKMVLSFGMGVDSSVILHRWLTDPTSRDFDLADLIVLIAQVGDEFAQTARLVEQYLFPLLRQHGVRTVQIARATSKTGKKVEVNVLDDTTSPTRVHIEGAFKLSDEMVNAGTIPVKCGRLCSIHAKGEPLDAWLRAEFQGTPFTHTIGFNADEDNRRQRDKSYTRDDSIKRQPCYPLFDWDMGRDACEDYLEQQVGEKWAKSCCSFCPFSDGKTEHLERLADEPEAMATALNIEHRALALNPKMKLYADRSLLECLEAYTLQGGRLSNTMSAGLIAWHRSQEAAEHALYRVRRVWARWEKLDEATGKVKTGWNAYRALEVLATGTKMEMNGALYSKAIEDGTQPSHDALGFNRHVVSERDPDQDCLEEMYAVGLAGALPKKNQSFNKKRDQALGLGQLSLF
jgi:hypothetical protein